MAHELLRLYLDDTSSDPAKQFFKDNTLTDLLERVGGDEEAAASMGWGIKAANVSQWYDVNKDGSNLSRAQVFKHCTTMAKFYGERSSADLSSVLISREPPKEEEGEFIP